MPKATYKGAVIAQSDATIVVEGNHYFPPESVNRQYLADNAARSPLKGQASYYDVVVDGDTNPGAAWYYPEPKSAAAEIKELENAVEDVE